MAGIVYLSFRLEFQVFVVAFTVHNQSHMPCKACAGFEVVFSAARSKGFRSVGLFNRREAERKWAEMLAGVRPMKTDSFLAAPVCDTRRPQGWDVSDRP
ncbi:MAG: hypothetical protein ACOVT5_09080, partial [Armatimonadaceae bacterium]